MPTTEAVDPAPRITTPGIYQLTDDQYHRDPVPGGSLSSTGARKLLPPGCPARYHHDRHADTTTSTTTFDIGKVAHLLVLGAGARLVVVEAPDWRTRAAREQRDAAWATGRTPILTEQYDQAAAMAAAVRRHPAAAALLDPTTGDPEQSLFWTDPPTGTWLRARVDFLRHRAPGRVIVVDYKTTTAGDLDHVSRSIHAYGYHQQAAWYLAGVRALGIAVDPAFVFVFQEKTPPHLVATVQLDPIAERIGAQLNRRAIDLYHQCTTTGHWPGYPDDVQLVTLPTWAERQHEENL